jgi:hypothetical protein
VIAIVVGQQCRIEPLLARVGPTRQYTRNSRSKHRRGAGGQALGIARRCEPRPAAPRPRSPRRSARSPRPGLRLVHRRLRHARPQRGKGAAKRTDVSRSASMTKSLTRMTASWATRPAAGGASRSQNAGLSRRRHRRDDYVGRSCIGARPELRARLVRQRRPEIVCRPARHRDRPCRNLATAQPARPGRLGSPHNRRRAFYTRHFDEAVPKLLLAIQEDPSLPNPYRYLAACYAHMGRLDEARAIARRLQTITGVVIPDLIYLRNAEHRELYLSGLRLAADEAT